MHIHTTQFTMHTPTPTHICTPHTNTPIHILVIYITHAHTCTHMHTHAHSCTHMHTHAHTNTYLYTSFRRSVCFFGCAASWGSRRKMVYSCTPWLTYKSGIKDTRSRILSCSCEIMHRALPFFSIQSGNKATDRALCSISYKVPSQRKIDGALTCVLMEPWSSSWSHLRSGGSIWTVEDRSNVFLSIASMAT